MAAELSSHEGANGIPLGRLGCNAGEKNCNSRVFLFCMIKRRIMAPGPTEVPPSVLAAAGQPILHHRTPQFRQVFQQVSEDIKYVFQTQQPVLTFAAGGTGGMEAIVVNLSRPGEK